MLASAPQDKFDLELPVIAIRAMDPDSLVDNLDKLKNSADELNAALTNYVPSAAPGNAAATNRAIAAINDFNRSLGLVSNKSVTGAAYVGTTLSIPSKKYAFALQVDARAEGGGIFNYADQAQVGDLITALTACATGNPANAATCAGATTLYDPVTGKMKNLASKFNVRAVVFKEVGISFATQVKELSDVNIGITPKFIKLTSYDYEIKDAAQSSDNKITLDQGKKEDSLFNIDVGVVKLFKTEKGNDVRAGLVAKNILSKSVTTVTPGNKVDIAPQLTAGGGYSTGLITAGADLDLIANKPLLPGIGKESQYLRLGAEFDAWRWAQFRLGYRHDLKGNNPGLPSVGLGVSVLGLHTDLSVAYASKKEAAAAWQLGFNF
jgi:hypothetical protein